MKTIYFIAALSLFLVSGCSDVEDNYSTTPNHQLSFSTDTLTFDTVFTTVGSATKQFMVYNRNKKALNIESIVLANKGNSAFKINVDGRIGTDFSDIEILPKDSIYIFVEVTIDPHDSNTPFEVKDEVEFIYNGNKQSVLLQAFGQDTYIIQGGLRIEKDTILNGKRPFLVYDSICIEPGVTVNIEAGARFYLHNKAHIEVYGTVIAQGTLEKPIVFRGDRMDDLLPGRLAYDDTPGLWDGITFHTESYNNRFEQVIVRNGRTGLRFLPSTPEQLKIVFLSSQITNMAGNLLYAENCHIEAANTEFTNAQDSLITLSGGKYHFVHCTIANFMQIKSRSGAPSVVLQHNSPVSGREPYPIESISFENCIIDGSWSQSSGEIVVEGEKTFDFRFTHCLLRQKEDLENTENCLFISGLNNNRYRMNGKAEENYKFDFRLKSDESGYPEAIGGADITIARLYPIDRYGTTRVSNDILPDIGAYQYVPELEKKEE
ncbi:MAG: hypothetical protein PHF41_12650 [Massilibacteroides sp.]|nr:hypothetical protein [Massilibacteroides sp.]